MIRIKICCIQSEAELRLAADAGADAVGLVAEMDTPDGPLVDDRIAALVRAAPAAVSCFLLTPATEVDALVAHQRRTGADVVQVCDHVAPDVLGEVRRRAGCRVVAVVHAGADDPLSYALAAAREADALLLDSGTPGADFRLNGGTGRTHDWAVAARIVAAVDVPVWLAGGLHAGNVADAVQTVRPAGVDLCTGVRVEGRLDPVRLEAFVQAARATAEVVQAPRVNSF